MENLPPDYWATSSAYTPHIYRDQYPSIDPTSASLSQAGKTIIITGATAGIGARGIVPAFAKAGPKALVLVGRNDSALKKVEEQVKSINSSIQVLAKSVSISDEDSVEQLYKSIQQQFGHADVLVNNAGVNNEGGFIGDSAPKSWWNDFEVNVRGTYLMTRGFLKLLGKEKQGSIVSLSTGLAAMVAPTMSAYSLSKLTVLRLMEYVAAEYGNVSAVSIQPGVVNTEMVVGKFSYCL